MKDGLLSFLNVWSLVRRKARRLPRKGDVYEALEDVEVIYMTSYRAPCTGGGIAVLPKGERVRSGGGTEGFPRVYCDAVRYDELHDRIVPREERESEFYTGYYFSIDIIVLNTKFRLLSGGSGDASSTVQ